MALLDRLSLLIDADTRGAEAGFRRVGDAARRNLGEAESAVGSVTAGSRALAVGAAVGAAGFAALGAAVVAGVNSFRDSAAEIRKFEQVSGASAEAASKLVATFDDLNVDSKAAGQAVFRLGRLVAANTDVLTAHGIAVAQSANGTTDLAGTLLNVADAYTGIEDPAKRSQLVFDTFGRSGAALIPILEQGREGLQSFFADAEAHGQVFSQAEIDQAREYDLAVDDLSDSFGHLERSLGTAFVPILSGVADAVSTVVDGIGNFVDKLSGTSRAEREAESAWNAMIDQMMDGNKVFDDLSSGIGDFVNQFDAVNSAQRRVEDSTDAVTAALEKLHADQIRDSTANLSEAEDGLSRARLNQERATERVSDAQARLNELRRQDPAKLIADAQRAANDAATAHARAQQSLIDRQNELNRLRDIGGSPNDVADAEIAVQEAQNAVADSGADAADAQAKLNDVRANGNHREIADAERDLRDAVLGQHDAVRSVTEAQGKLNEVRANDKAKQLAEDQRTLQRAIEDQAEAARTAAEKQAEAAGRASTAVQEGVQAQIDVLSRYGTQLGKVDPQIASFIAHRIAELQGILDVGRAGVEAAGPSIGDVVTGNAPGGGPGGIGGVFPTVPTTPPSDSGIGRLFPDAPGPAHPQSLGRTTIVNVQARDMSDAFQQIDARERLHNLARG